MEEKNTNFIEEERTARFVASLKEKAEKTKAIEDMLEEAVEMTHAVGEEIGFIYLNAAIEANRYIDNQGEYDEAFKWLCLELFVRHRQNISFEQMEYIYDHLHSNETFKKYSNYEFHTLWNLAMEQIDYWECHVIGEYDNIMKAISDTVR